MPLTGTELIKDYLATLPRQPGVYRMLDEDGAVLYVGKARDLKARVSNYASLAGKNQRIATMILRTAKMEFITTRNESEALLLEANLIKKLEPHYNILLRDGKSFPLLHFSHHDFPRLVKHRGKQDKKGQYFGPFASAGALNATITQLQKIFLLRPCTDNYFHSRTRPCLQYQIKRCSAPCVDYISKQDYARLVKQATQFMRGENSGVQEQLRDEMLQASQAQHYEKAAILRDRMKALSQIQREQGLHLPQVREADLIALAREGGVSCVQVFFFRDGQNYGNQPHFLHHAPEESNAEILAAFLPQFYQHRRPPREILLSETLEEQALLEEALGELAEHKLTLHTPQRGDKRAVVEQAAKNARQALQRHLESRQSQQKLLEKLVPLFGLPRLPQRIEVYDNSHISSQHAIGAMIVAGPDGFMKNHYRKFNIQQAQGDDDYGMMREVLGRRLRHFAHSPLAGESNLSQTDLVGGEQAARSLQPSLPPTESLRPDGQSSSAPPQGGSDKSAMPDLLLIDGGKGQLSVVCEVLAELGLTDKIAVVGIAKGPDRHAGREKFFLPGKPMFQLPVDDPVLHYLQRLRDEAHRFAIGTHRTKRAAQIQKSALDDVPGIGAKRKKALLLHFGSARAVRNASQSELSAVEGLSRAMAEKIWQHFHS
jgi:excinuclease ABC subunit C